MSLLKLTKNKLLNICTQLNILKCKSKTKTKIELIKLINNKHADTTVVHLINL